MNRIFGSKISAVILTVIILAGIIFFQDFYKYAVYIPRIYEYTADDFRLGAFIYDTDETVRIYKTRGGFGSKTEIDGISYKKLNYFEWKKYHNLIQEKQK